MRAQKLPISWRGYTFGEQSMVVRKDVAKQRLYGFSVFSELAELET